MSKLFNILILLVTFTYCNNVNASSVDYKNFTDEKANDKYKFNTKTDINISNALSASKKKITENKYNFNIDSDSNNQSIELYNINNSINRIEQEYNITDYINSNYDLNSNSILCNELDNYEPYNKTVKILSLDGGGTRGYIQSKFLELFCKDANINDMSKYFDLIAGTSVGGLNAIACANGSIPKFMSRFFREQSPWIFTVRNWKDKLLWRENASYPSNKPNKLQMMYMMLISNPFYKSVSKNSNYGEVKLRNELNNIFGNKLLTSIKTPVLLTAHNYSEYTPVIFTNAEIEGIPNTFRNIEIVDALMATTSCPIYFPSTRLKLSPDPNEPAYNIIDGGLFQNNPSSLAFTISQIIYPQASEYCILSIGTGIGKIGMHISSKEAEPSTNSFTQYTNFLDIAMNNSQIDNDILFKGLSSNKYSNVHYYRFNIQLDSNRDCSFDNSSKEFFDYLDIAVTKKYEEDFKKIKNWINKPEKQ